MHPEKAAEGEFAVEKDVMEWHPGGSVMEQHVPWSGHAGVLQHQAETPGLTEESHTCGLEWKNR